MQIENKPFPSMLPLPSLSGRELPAAQQHLAELPARLALMRWMRGGDIPHAPVPPREMWRRAAWYGGLQTEFESWLKAGGFHGADLDDLGDLGELGNLGSRLQAQGGAGTSDFEPRVTATKLARRRRALSK